MGRHLQVWRHVGLGGTFLAILAAPVAATVAQQGKSTSPPQASAPQAAAPQIPAADSAQEARIDGLIKQLAADDFAARERAQGELSQLGLEAFDALHAAQNHHDPEIALRARYLVRSMSVRWFTESDSPQVVNILKGYGDVPEPERRSRIDRLAALESGAGLVPLVRLSRFETHEPTAKYAALKLLAAGPPEGQAEKAALIRAIEETVGKSKRTSAAGWLRLYARTLVDPAATLVEWDEATKAEHEMSTKSSHLTSDEIVRDLYRFQVDLLDRAGRHEQAVEVIRRTFELIDAEEAKVAEVIDWLTAREAYRAVLDLIEEPKLSQLVQGNALLLYRLAETYLKLDEPEKAEETASRALALNPDNLPEHYRIGYMLDEQRGLYDWAQREYRLVLKAAPAGSLHDYTTRFRLSMLLHDQAQELAAAEMLKPICDAMEKDPAAEEACRRAGRPPNWVVAQMHYYYACHYREQQDVAKQREHLDQAIAANDEDTDVLIAMYRVPVEDEAWKMSVRERIESAANRMRQEIEAAEMLLPQADQAERDDFEEGISIRCNEYAWLVGNTFGDFDDAIKRSHRSLQIKPGREAYLDTLGRCYYAKRDFVNAVKYQLQAVQASRSGQIRRQLDLFLKEAESAGVELPAKLREQVRQVTQK